MRAFARPKVVVSKCMEYAACRYNGDKINEPIVLRLADYVEFIPVCPEVEIGLGTPHEVIRLVSDGETSKLIQPKTNKDLTRIMTQFADDFIARLTDVDGFLLKSRSPSCGIADAKIYASSDNSPVVRTGSGSFTTCLQAAFPKSWCYRFNNEYLLNQTYFEPYPEELIAISDSGKGRALS